MRAKGHDTFCPVGPWIDTDVDPSDLDLRTEVNGQVRQQQQHLADDARRRRHHRVGRRR